MRYQTLKVVNGSLIPKHEAKHYKTKINHVVLDIIIKGTLFHLMRSSAIALSITNVRNCAERRSLPITVLRSVQLDPSDGSKMVL